MGSRACTAVPSAPDMQCRLDATPLFTALVGSQRHAYAEYATDYCAQGGSPACLERTFWVLDHREQPAHLPNTNLTEARDLCLESDRGACLVEAFQDTGPELTEEEAATAALDACR